MTNKRKRKPPSTLNLCCNVIYHVRKMASMESGKAAFKHHLAFAKKYLKEVSRG